MGEISKEDNEKILALKERLRTTYKISTNAEQKKRIITHLAKIDSILKDISLGKDISEDRLAELNIKKISQNGENAANITSTSDNSSASDNRDYLKDDIGNFAVKYVEIHGNTKDTEINEIYSYFLFLESVYLPPLSQIYLKMDFNFGRDRDIIFNKFDMAKHLVNSYVEDYKMLASLVGKKEQYDSYKERMKQQRQYLLVKLGEFLHEFDDFLLKVIDNMKTNKPNILNPDDIYKNDFVESKYLDGRNYRDIVKSLESYTLFFINILRIPNFKKSGN